MDHSPTHCLKQVENIRIEISELQFLKPLKLNLDIFAREVLHNLTQCFKQCSSYSFMLVKHSSPEQLNMLLIKSAIFIKETQNRSSPLQ